VPTTTITNESRSPRDLLAPALAVVALAALVALFLTGEHGPTADLLRTLLHQETTTIEGQDFSILWDTSTKLLPLGLLMCVSVFPIAGIVGGVMFAGGNRKGLSYIGFAGAACVLVAVLGALAN